MAVSGISSWNPVLQTIIRAALLNATAIDENEEPDAALYYRALDQLNGLTKSIEATGLHVWTEEEAILFPQPGAARFVIGGSSPTANACDAFSWVQATLAANSAAAATTVTVEDDAGISDGDVIGVQLSTNLWQWTTVNGAPALNVVTLADPLEAAVESGVFAVTYPPASAIGRPLKIPDARLFTLQSLQETQMTVLSRSDYMDLPDKTSQGVPTQWFYSPRREDGQLFLWPVANLPAWAIRFTWYRPLQDFISPTNTGDFPQEWINPLIWNLSKELAPSYGVPEATWARIKEMADNYALLALSYDRESEPVQFGLDLDGG